MDMLLPLLVFACVAVPIWSRCSDTDQQLSDIWKNGRKGGDWLRFAKEEECCFTVAGQFAAIIEYQNEPGLGGFHCQDNLWCNPNQQTLTPLTVNDPSHGYDGNTVAHLGKCAGITYHVPMDNYQAWHGNQAGGYYAPPSGDFQSHNPYGDTPMPPPSGPSYMGTGSFQSNSFQANDGSDSDSDNAHAFNAMPPSGPPSFQPSHVPSHGGSGIGNTGNGFDGGRKSFAGLPSALDGLSLNDGGSGAGKPIGNGRNSFSVNPSSNMGKSGGMALGKFQSGTQSFRALPSANHLAELDDQDEHSADEDDHIVFQSDSDDEEGTVPAPAPIHLKNMDMTGTTGKKEQGKPEVKTKGKKKATGGDSSKDMTKRRSFSSLPPTVTRTLSKLKTSFSRRKAPQA